MMRHPIHLHGHDFRLLNGQGDYVPLKNIVDIMPMETDTLEFNANAEGGLVFSLPHTVPYDGWYGEGFYLQRPSTKPRNTKRKIGKAKIICRR